MFQDNVKNVIEQEKKKDQGSGVQERKVTSTLSSRCGFDF